MIRRSFIKAVSLLSLTPLLGWDKVFDWFKSAKPVTDEVREIFAVKGYMSKFQLHSRNPIPIMDAGPPKYSTWKEYYTKTYGDCGVEVSEEEAKAAWRLYQMGTADEVYFDLRHINLSKELHDKVQLWCVPAPYTGFIGVEVENEESLGKLEKELKLVEINWKFKVIEEWDELKFNNQDFWHPFSERFYTY